MYLVLEDQRRVDVLLVQGWAELSVAMRRAVRHDAEVMFEVERSAALVAFANVFPVDRYPYPDKQARARWQDALRDGREVFIAERDGQAVGFVAVAAGRLEALFVVPSAWGQGVADALHEQALCRLRRLGSEAQLWVQETNRRARRFYERRGWKPDGRRSPVPHPPHPELIGYVIEFRRK